jgi:hypothetical protein
MGEIGDKRITLTGFMSDLCDFNRVRYAHEGSGWNPPPLMIRAVRAHCHNRTRAPQQMTGRGAEMRRTPAGPPPHANFSIWHG